MIGRKARKRAAAADWDMTHSRWRVTSRRTGRTRTVGFRAAAKAEERGDQVQHVPTRHQRRAR